MFNPTWPLWTALIPVVSFLLIVVGIWLFRRAWRRVDDHPVCRKCGFDLFGAPPSSTRCPECGNELASPRATRIGNYALSKSRRLIAVALILLSLLVTTFVGREVYNRVNFQPIKPDWWLAMELGSNDFVRRGMAIGTLLDRAKSNSVSEANCLKLEDVILELMPRFAATSDQIDWLNERIMGNPHASKQRLEKLARATLGNRLFSVRSKVAAGDPLPIDMTFGSTYRVWRDPSELAGGASDRHPIPYAIATRPLSVRVDGTGPFELVGDPFYSDQGIDLSSRTGGYKTYLLSDRLRSLKPGKHTIELQAEFTVRAEMRTDVQRGQYLPNFDPSLVRTIAQLTISETRSFDLLPEDQASSSLITDESERGQITSGIELRPFPETNPTGCMLTLGRLPAGVAFEVFFSQAGRETRVGVISSPPHGGLGTAFSYPDDAKPGLAELVFKPNLKIATDAVEVYDIWDGELRFPITVGKAPSTAPAQ